MPRPFNEFLDEHRPVSKRGECFGAGTLEILLDVLGMLNSVELYNNFDNIYRKTPAGRSNGMDMINVIK